MPPLFNADVAQLAEQALRKRQVVGSIPTVGFNYPNFWIYRANFVALGN